MSLRIRQVKPGFWTDPAMADLPPEVRLFYIGLWCAADDAGYLRVEAAALAAELMPFEGRARREAKVARFLAMLLEAGHVVTYDCGHGVVPTLVKHQHFAGPTKRVYTTRNEHERCIPAGARRSPQVPALVSEGIGQVRLVNGEADPRSPDGGSAQSSLKDRIGDYADIVKR